MRAQEDLATAGLGLEVTAVTPGPGGRLAHVTARLSNDSEQTRQVFHDQLVVELLDRDGSPVTEAGWRQPAAQEVVLPPGGWLELTAMVGLRGPRRGACSAPLRPGRYNVRARLTVGV